MYSIIALTESIKDELQSKCNKINYRFKSCDDTDKYIEIIPHVYVWTYDDLEAGMPLHTPSILVQLISIDDDETASYIVHVCVCNPALQDKEITRPVSGMGDLYEYMSTDGLNTSNIRSELYKSCVMLAEQVMIYIKQMSNTNYSFKDIVLNTPSPYMADFPYCQCTIEFSARKSVVQSQIDTKVWELL